MGSIFILPYQISESRVSRNFLSHYNGFLLQTGHLFSVVNHLSMHSWQNSCPHFSSLNLAPVINFSKQIMQLSSLVRPSSHIFVLIVFISALENPRFTWPAFSCNCNNYSCVILSTSGLFGSSTTCYFDSSIALCNALSSSSWADINPPPPCMACIIIFRSATRCSISFIAIAIAIYYRIALLAYLASYLAISLSRLSPASSSKFC